MSDPTRHADRLAFRPPELAALLGVSPRTLRRWMRDEGLPYLRLDGVVLIPRASLEDWMTERASDERRRDRVAAEILESLSK